jgi:nucleoside-diphosphate-sugar epimerase
LRCGNDEVAGPCYRTQRFLTYVITEKTPTVNPYWEYSQRKIACEALLKDQTKLPWTIVRPSHTVRTGLPTMMNEGDLIRHLLLAGRPVLVTGDGTTPWTPHSLDFSAPFVRLFGNGKALGEDFHITSDRGYGRDDIYRTVAANIVHVPTDTLIRYQPAWEGPLLGDKTWAALFDNSKVKSVAGPFTCSERLDEILDESVAHFRTRLAQQEHQPTETDALMDRIAADQSALGAN